MKKNSQIILLLVFITLPIFIIFGNDSNGIKLQSFNNEPEQIFDVDISREAIIPLSPVTGLSADKVNLGKKLFHDAQLSHDNSIFCASCHDLSKGGTDRLRFSKGINGATGNVNAPTVFNSSLNLAQFWDGRAKSLQEQVVDPICNPAELGSSFDEVVGKLTMDGEYRQAFQHLYTDGVTPENVADAIANYEKSLITLNARFDRYLRGEMDAITKDELLGYREFIDHGCTSCHQGAGIGGNFFQRFGIMGNYFEGRPVLKADQGRFNVTGLESDRHVFKVPSLRNVAVTPPYFHDGSVETLEETVQIMGHYQLGTYISDEDARLIVAFLHTLTGEWEGRLLE